MKPTVPEELKKEVPRNAWGKVLTATPVVMTVIATLLAGLASSEMTRAQNDRAFAAQLQSKVGDQWGYFQSKKLRSAMQHSAMDILLATSDVPPVGKDAVGKDAVGKEAVGKDAIEKIPVPAVPAYDANIQSAIESVEQQKPEVELVPTLKRIDDKTLAAALQAARDQSRDFGIALRPANQALEQLEKLIRADDKLGGDKSAARGLAVAKMQFAARRLDAEALLNQNIANLLELQVRKVNISADRHQQRSGEFFYGMLSAQAAVIIATIALAARQRNTLWSLSATAGLAAVAFAGYVYLWR